MIRIPAAARARAISGRFPKSSSISALGALWNAYRSMAALMVSPMTPVIAVARKSSFRQGHVAFHEEKYVSLPGPPEIDDHREHRTGMEHHEKQGHFRCGGVQTEDLLGDDHVGGARYRQKLREALNDRQNSDREDEVQDHTSKVGSTVVFFNAERRKFRQLYHGSRGKSIEDEGRREEPGDEGRPFPRNRVRGHWDDRPFGTWARGEGPIEIYGLRVHILLNARQ